MSKTAEEIAIYLDGFANRMQKEAAAFVRAQAKEIHKLKLQIAALERADGDRAEAEYQRQLDEDARENTLYIQCGGLE